MTFDNLRILVIDDDEDDFILLSESFEEIGFPRKLLEWARSYSEGRARLAEKRHDVYLIDYRLGEGTGLDLLKEAIAAGVTAPMLLLTGVGEREIDLEAMKQGAADYLVKGEITPRILERAVRYSVYRAGAQEQLRRREQEFRRLFNSTFEGVIIHSSGRVIDINEPAASIFGYTREELIGRDLVELAAPQSRQAVLTNTRARGDVSYEIQILRKDGTRISLEIRAKDYEFRGQPARLTAVRDVTARKQMEAQVLLQDRLASIGLLASSLAHEIGNPLGVIRGRAEFIQMRAQNDPEIRKYADVIHSQIDRVSTLIRSLLKLARGENLASQGTVSLAEVVNESVELIGYEAKKKNIRLENAIDPAATIRVRAEAQPLHQVILNLVINAIHAVQSEMANGGKPEGGHSIRIYLEDRGEFWGLCVKDSGTGISETNLKQLFKPFFTTKDIGQGTGLGLVTSYRIVEGWGGKIEVESEEGKGALFRVLLPKAG